MPAGTTDPGQGGRDGTWIHTGYAQRIIFGLDSIDRIAEVVKEAGGRKVMLVTTTGRRRSPEGQRLIEILGRRMVSVKRFPDFLGGDRRPDCRAAVTRRGRNGSLVSTTFGQ